MSFVPRTLPWLLLSAALAAVAPAPAAAASGGTVDLSVALTAPAAVGLGDSLTYTVKVSKVGAGKPTRVRLHDVIPPSLVFDKAVGARCTGTTSITCPIGKLPATVSIVLHATGAGTATTAVSVSSRGTDRNRANNRASATSVVALRFAPVVRYRTDLAAASSLAEAQVALRSFGTKYGVSIDVTAPEPAPFGETFQRLAGSDLDALKVYGGMFIDEWAKYPPAFVAWSRLHTIKLVKGLIVYGGARAAAPAPELSAMLYDIGAGTGEYAREVIHHEFDHFFTFNQYNAYAPADPGWVALNPPGFHYGNGGASCYVGPCPAGPHVVPGFASGYATSAIEEDKAETFGYLMVATLNHGLADWVKSDAYLRAKVDYYEAYLCNISAAMCKNYFEELNP